MKFLIDMPLSPTLGDWLQKLGHDAVHVSKIGMATAEDRRILEAAQKQRRIIVTADLDFSRLIAIEEIELPPLILFRGGNYSEQEIKKLMERVLTAIPAQEIEHSIVVVDKTRIRKVHLPIVK